MTWVQDDGGRQGAGYRGTARDCVVRAIAIATRAPYQDVYDGLRDEAVAYAAAHRDKVARKIEKRGPTPRDGVHRPIYEAYLLRLGWVWTPTMAIGSGCQVHLRASELPEGRLVVRVSRHVVAVVDGLIRDTSDPSYNGQRCVYGYFAKARGTE